MIQEVEKLCPKLEILSFPHPVVLRERKIQIELSRPDHCISPDIAKEPQGLDNKVRRIEITFRRPVIEHWIDVPAGAKVRSLVTALRHTAGLARSHLDVDGQAAANGIGPIHGPAPQHVLDWTTRLVSPMAAGTERQFIAVAENKVVRNVERGEAPLGRKIVPVVDGEAGGSGNLFSPLDSGSSSVIDVARPGVGGIECQPIARTLLHYQLERVINLTGNWSDIAIGGVVRMGHLSVRRSELP